MQRVYMEDETKTRNERGSRHNFQGQEMVQVEACFGIQGNHQKYVEDTALVALLKVCAKQKNLYKGSLVHADIVRRGLLGKNAYVGNTLVNMYAKCGALAKAQQVFNELPIQSVVSWNALIAGYAQQGHGKEALNCFRLMQRDGLSPDAVTFACILKACGSIGAFEKGKEIHAQIVKEGLLGKDSVLGNALVDMYAKIGALAKAQVVFDDLPVRTVVSWNVLIAGYAQHGCGEEALKCFELMEREGLSGDSVTFCCLLKACSSIGAVEKGEEIHAEVVRLGLLRRNSVLGNALVDMYAKCGALVKAQQVFEELHVRNVASWTALITGYAQHGNGEEALHVFERMRDEGLAPDVVTFLCILKACGSVGATEKGKEIHAGIAREGLLSQSTALGNALIEMYAKCGAPAKAQQVFEELPFRNVVSWTALIAGYAQTGEHDTVFYSYNKMIGEGIEPDMVTFSVVLNACCYSGLVEKGEMYFESMITRFGIIPTFEHYTCMVDLFGRTGHFAKAMAVIENMPSPEHRPVWFALLGACQKWGNVELGRLAFERAVQLGEKSAGAYVCMSNIYAAAGMQEEADKIEAMRRKKEVRKTPGRCWWTNANGNIQSFCVGDKGHSQSKNIFLKIRGVTRKLSQHGYCPDLHWVSQDMSDDATENESEEGN